MRVVRQEYQPLLSYWRIMDDLTAVISSRAIAISDRLHGRVCTYPATKEGVATFLEDAQTGGWGVTLSPAVLALVGALRLRAHNDVRP